MANELQSSPEDTSRSAMSANVQGLQKITTLIVKAGFSSIPWAALVFDLGQAAVDFGNAKLTERFLEDLGKRVDALEDPARKALNRDGVYEIAAHIAIRRLLTETNVRVADALSRAVGLLEKENISRIQRMEVARALEVLTEPALHLLQTYYRFHGGKLTAEEIFGSDEVVSNGSKLGTLVVQSMELLQWNSTFSTLQTSGLISPGVDGGEVGAEHYMSPQTLTLLGIKIVELCFENPEIPLFGKFAIDETPDTV